MIQFQDLHKSFGEKPVLAGFTLTVPDQETVVIIGYSGTGKSVALKHVVGLLQPDAGDVIVDGRAVSTLERDALMALRREIGFVFQFAALFDSMSVFDNVAFPLVEKTNMAKSEIEQQVMETLGAVGLEGMERKYPSQMSGGMQKRAALARALVRRPKILMLDEPTTGLDPSRTGAIHDLIRRTQQNFQLTAVMVSHDVPAVFEVSDRVAFLHQGKTHLNGTVEEVMAADDDVFKRFLAGEASGPENEALAG